MILNNILSLSIQSLILSKPPFFSLLVVWPLYSSLSSALSTETPPLPRLLLHRPHQDHSPSPLNHIYGRCTSKCIKQNSLFQTVDWIFNTGTSLPLQNTYMYLAIHKFLFIATSMYWFDELAVNTSSSCCILYCTYSSSSSVPLSLATKSESSV